MEVQTLMIDARLLQGTRISQSLQHHQHITLHLSTTTTTLPPPLLLLLLFAVKDDSTMTHVSVTIMLHYNCGLSIQLIHSLKQ